MDLARIALAGALAFIAASSLVIGAFIGLKVKVPQKLIAVIMAFGAGALINALAIELAFGGAEHLIHEGKGPIMAWVVVALGFIAGGATYQGANMLVEKRGAALRNRSLTKAAVMERMESMPQMVEKMSQVHTPYLVGHQHVTPKPIDEATVEKALHSLEERLHLTQGHEALKQGLGQLNKTVHLDVMAHQAQNVAGAVTDVARGGVQQVGGKVLDVADSVGVDLHGAASAVTGAADMIGSGLQGAASGVLGFAFGKQKEPEAPAESADTPSDEPTVEDYTAVDEPEAAAEPAPAPAAPAASAAAAAGGAGVATAVMDAEPPAAVAADSFAGGVTMFDHGMEKELADEHEEHGGAPMAIFIGALLDGVPESIVIGAGVLKASLAAVNPTFIVAVFMSNLPEALSAAAGMKKSGMPEKKILSMWAALVVACVIAAMVGNALLISAPTELAIVIEAFAGGGILAMLAATMMPEAFEEGGAAVGLATITGFLAAFYFTADTIATELAEEPAHESLRQLVQTGLSLKGWG